MAMPDAVDALLTLAAARRDRLTRSAYNLAAFNPSASAIRDSVVAAFPAATIGFNVYAKRQGIIDSWPAAVDDSAARRDGIDPHFRLDGPSSACTIGNPSAIHARRAQRATFDFGTLLFAQR
jgi:hypothetical protein